ncbi:MAG: hypothetical protein JST45_05695 [Bacteroidetes bacterium]|nr:hypothetical protein [Bacteroidota bacterium]
MHKLAIDLHVIFLRFERWFERYLGWFFTNGMKNGQGSGTGTTLPEVPGPKA